MKPRRWLWAAGLIVGVAVVIVGLAYAGEYSRTEVRHWLDRWSIAEWAVALGTISLALYTYSLARGTRQQIDHQREVAEEATRPIVYPVATDEWVRSGQRRRYLRIRNGGLGPALSVEGIIEWNAPGASPKPQNAVWPSGGLGPGEERLTFLARPGIDDWHNARGVLVFTGVGSRRWRTDFSSQIEEGDIVVLRVASITQMQPDDVAALPD